MNVKGYIKTYNRDRSLGRGDVSIDTARDKSMVRDRDTNMVTGEDLLSNRTGHRAS